MTLLRNLWLSISKWNALITLINWNRTILLTLLLYTRRNPFTLVLLIIVVIAFGLVFWATRGISFGYTKSKLSDNARSTFLAIHIILSLVLSLALPNNYLKNFSFFESLYTQNEIWIPISMFLLLVFFVTIFGFILSILFRPLTKDITNPIHSDNPDESYGPSRYRFSTLIMVSIGAFILWLLSGFQGTFNERMSRYY